MCQYINWKAKKKEIPQDGRVERHTQTRKTFRAGPSPLAYSSFGLIEGVERWILVSVVYIQPRAISSIHSNHEHFFSETWVTKLEGYMVGQTLFKE